MYLEICVRMADGSEPGPASCSSPPGRGERRAASQLPTWPPATNFQLDLEERKGIPTAVWAVGAPPGGKVTDWRQEACTERGGGQCWTQKDLKLRSRAGVRPGLCPP